jgi:hypothetical protein
MGYTFPPGRGREVGCHGRKFLLHNFGIVGKLHSV